VWSLLWSPRPRIFSAHGPKRGHWPACTELQCSAVHCSSLQFTAVRCSAMAPFPADSHRAQITSGPSYLMVFVSATIRSSFSSKAPYGTWYSAVQCGALQCSAVQCSMLHLRHVESLVIAAVDNSRR
jgi:hypothetical protein